MPTPTARSELTSAGTSAQVEVSPTTRWLPRMADSKMLKSTLWLSVASLVGGCLSLAQHLVTQRCLGSPGDYGLYLATREKVTQYMMPLIGLQLVCARIAMRAREVSDAEDPGCRCEVPPRVLFYSLIGGVFAIAYTMLRTTPFFEHKTSLFIAAFGATVALLGCTALSGCLQGAGMFGRLSLAKALTDLSLLAGVWSGVSRPSAGAQHAMIGFAIGAAVAFCLCLALAGSLSRSFSVTSISTGLLTGLAPITVGLAVPAYLLSDDMIVVQEHLPVAADAYGAARAFGRSLLFLTTPVACILFPALGRDACSRLTSRQLSLVIVATAALSMGFMVVGAAWSECLRWGMSSYKLLCWSPVLPMYLSALTPTIVATFFINALLARGQFRHIPLLVIPALSYGLLLRRYHGSVEGVVAILAAAGWLLFGLTLALSRQAITAQKPSP